MREESSVTNRGRPLDIKLVLMEQHYVTSTPKNIALALLLSYFINTHVEFNKFPFELKNANLAKIETR